MLGTGYGHYGTRRIPSNNADHVRTAASGPSTASVTSPKPARPLAIRIVNGVKSVVDELCTYLGKIAPVNNDQPPALKALNTGAYILTLPTGAQLRMINRAIGEDGCALPIANDRTIQDVAKALDQYNRLVNRYNLALQSGVGVRSKLVEGIQNKLNDVDEKLKNAIAKPGSGRSGAYQALRNGLRDAETLRGLRTDWRYWEMLGVSPAEYDQVADNPDAIEEWLDQGFSAKQALSFKNAGYQPDQVLHLKDTGITGPIAKRLIQRGYTREFFEETMGKPARLAQTGFHLRDHHDAWAENQGREFGQGLFNTVTARFFRDEEDHCEHERIFKPEKFVVADNGIDKSAPAYGSPLQVYEEAAGKGNNSGLCLFEAHHFVGRETLAAPRLIGRNLASYYLSRAFGADVIVESELAISFVPLTGDEKARYCSSNNLPKAPKRVLMPGVMMEKAEHAYGAMGGDLVTLPADPGIDAELRRNLIWLQLLDHISGQADRHMGNIKIDAKGKVKGIDNDQCWPALVDDSNLLAMDLRNLDSGFKGTVLPLVVDYDMVARLCGFSDWETRKWRWGMLTKNEVQAARERAEEALSQAVKGCITQDELSAATRRLRLVQDHILKKEVIKVDTWGGDEVLKKMTGTLRFFPPQGLSKEVFTSYYGVLYHCIKHQ